jgi:hypothetical protein
MWGTEEGLPEAEVRRTIRASYIDSMEEEPVERSGKPSKKSK